MELGLQRELCLLGHVGVIKHVIMIDRVLYNKLFEFLYLFVFCDLFIYLFTYLFICIFLFLVKTLQYKLLLKKSEKERYTLDVTGRETWHLDFLFCLFTSSFSI